MSSLQSHHRGNILITTERSIHYLLNNSISSIAKITKKSWQFSIVSSLSIPYTPDLLYVHWSMESWQSLQLLNIWPMNVFVDTCWSGLNRCVMGLEDQYIMDNDLVRPHTHTEAKSCSQPSQPSAFGQVYMSYNFCTNSSYTLAVSASKRCRSCLPNNIKTCLLQSHKYRQ